MLNKKIKKCLASIHEDHEDLLIKIKGEDHAEVNSESDASDHRVEQCEIELDNEIMNRIDEEESKQSIDREGDEAHAGKFHWKQKIKTDERQNMMAQEIISRSKQKRKGLEKTALLSRLLTYGENEVIEILSEEASNAEDKGEIQTIDKIFDKVTEKLHRQVEKSPEKVKVAAKGDGQKQTIDTTNSKDSIVKKEEFKAQPS